jgi:hypothetical protein
MRWSCSATHARDEPRYGVVDSFDGVAVTAVDLDERGGRGG